MSRDQGPIMYVTNPASARSWRCNEFLLTITGLAFRKFYFELAVFATRKADIC